MKYNNINEVMENSIRIYNGLVAKHPMGEEEPIYTMEILPKFNGASVYCMNNSTVAFITGGEYYVTPYTREAMSAIRNVCIQGYFYVPFSNGDYPRDYKIKWEALRNQAKESYKRDYISDCEKWCDEHRIGAIEEDLLKKCFKMPETGIRIKHFNYEDTYYPAMNGMCVDCTVVDRIGKFCTNNGKVVFTYRDGATYVAKGYGILSHLRAAGYKESGIFVPFSNGEQILDRYLNNIWEGLPKISY